MVPLGLGNSTPNDVINNNARFVLATSISAFGTFSPSQAPHFRPPISGPHLRPSISDPPSQASSPSHLRPHALRVRLHYQVPTMSDPMLFVRDYNIRAQQCHTPRFSSETTISGPNNVSQVQKLNLNNDWLTYSLSQSSPRFNFCTWLSMEVRFSTDSTRGDSLRSSLSLSLHRSSLLINRLWNQGRFEKVLFCDLWKCFVICEVF